MGCRLSYWYIVYDYRYVWGTGTERNYRRDFGDWHADSYGVIDMHPMKWLNKQRTQSRDLEKASERGESLGPNKGWYEHKLTFFHEITKEHFETLGEE